MPLHTQVKNAAELRRSDLSDKTKLIGDSTNERHG